MPVERFYFSHELLSGEQISLKEREFHHLVHVIRIKEKETVELVNGQGVIATATVVRLKKQEAVLEILETVSYPPPLFEIILAQALPRINRLDFILEKGTELGMTQLWLFPGSYSERKGLSESQIDHMHQVTLAAMKQCGRVYIPSILIKPPLKKWEKLEYPSFFGDTQPTAPSFKQFLENPSKTKGIIFFIGPESGFSKEEEALLKQWGAEGVKLNDNILRTDTAAIAALTLITHFKYIQNVTQKLDLD